MSKSNAARRPEAARPFFTDADLPRMIALNTLALEKIAGHLEHFSKTFVDLVQAIKADRGAIIEGMHDVVGPLEFLLQDHVDMLRDTDALNGKSPRSQRVRPPYSDTATQVAANRVDPSVALFDDTPPKRDRPRGDAPA